ncbi:hypothetical protein SLS62_009157 [Diatrype stigma]|uniref:RRM domain-containing protein n=1 Tax=Diatrype stigma TaxID=117547 RepID=A0AAN9UHX9_9PEZI
MALPQSREGNFHPTSPHSSSGGAESFKGTPDTRFTGFSPDDGSVRSAKVAGSLNLITRDTAQAKYPGSSPSSLDLSKTYYRNDLQLERDPFVTATASAGKANQKLSPTASSFFPLHTPLVPRVSVSELDLSTKEKMREPNYAYPSTASRGLPEEDQCYVHSKLSTDNEMSRCLVISRLDGGKVGEVDIENYVSVSTSKFLSFPYYVSAHRFQELEKAGIPCHGSRDIFACGDKVCVRFSNIRTACAVISRARISSPGWSVEILTAREFSQIVAPASGNTTCHEGQLYLSVFPYGIEPNTDPKRLEVIVKRILQREGDLFAFKIQPELEGTILNAVIEYCENDMSLKAVSNLNGRVIDSLARADSRRDNAMRISRTSPYYNPNTHHNHVDVNRIREGTDVRTTIMLRNIPNKVDQNMLKGIVDQSSWGKYDFMYLRIDFANDCNVGYAFINFVDPLDIIDFVNARGNQRWNCFKSDKVAEISYATIQGKDCLVQKFRNSSVMLELEHYRPKASTAWF